MWPYFVYIHTRADDGVIFYIGKGTVKKGHCQRAFVSKGRSAYWHRVATKHGFVVAVVAHFRLEHDAHDFERSLISEHGRRALANLTDGGEGMSGYSPCAATRAKLSALAARPRSAAFISSIRRARKGGGNGGVVKRGDHLPASWRTAISKARRMTNGMRGRSGELSPVSRKVVGDGVSYPSVTAAALALGVKMKTLHNMLSGHRQNRFGLRFV